TQASGSALAGRNGSKPGARSANSAPAAWSPRNGHSNGAKPTAKAGSSPRPSAANSRSSSARKPAMTVGPKPSAGKRFGMAARVAQGSKKRG
ncbi:MAG: hypothetical protein WCE75_16685, partial [Terracidiphilus sp.]